MSATISSSIVTNVSAIPTSDANYKLKRAQTAIYLVLTSAQYQVER